MFVNLCVYIVKLTNEYIKTTMMENRKKNIDYNNL